MEQTNQQTGQVGKLVLLTLLGVMTLKAVTQAEAVELPQTSGADSEQVAVN